MRVCVYCGSSPGNDPRFVAAARAMGTALAQAEIGVVYGGGRVGLMGAVADAALAAGGEVIGIIPRFLEEREVAHSGVDLRVALPGGFGTLEEFFEIVTWVQLGLAEALCILANIDGYYDALLALIDGARRDGFVSAHNRAIVESFPTVEAVVRRLTEST